MAAPVGGSTAPAGVSIIVPEKTTDKDLDEIEKLLLNDSGTKRND